MNNLYFPAIKRYNTLTKLDLFAFYPIDPARTKFEGSIDGLPRKTSLGNIIDFIADNINISGDLNLLSDGTPLGDFNSLNFSSDFTLVDNGSGQATINFTGTTVAQNLFTDDLTLLTNRVHNFDTFNFAFNRGFETIFSSTLASTLLGYNNNDCVALESGVIKFLIGGTTRVDITATSLSINYLTNLTFRGPTSGDRLSLAASPLLTGVNNYLLPINQNQGYLFNSSGTLSWENIINPNTEYLLVACSPEFCDILVLPEAITFRSPFECTLTNIRASVTEEPTGDDIVIQVFVDGNAVYSTLLTIDDGDKTSVGSSTTPVFITPNLLINDDDEIKVEVIQVGSTQPGQGLKLTFELEKV